MKKKTNYALTVAIAIRYTSSELKTYADRKGAGVEREPVIREMSKLLDLDIYSMTTKECGEFFFPSMEY